MFTVCVEKKEKSTQTTVLKKVPPHLFVCNYPVNKQRSTELYRSSKINPSKTAGFIHFLRDSLFPCWYGTPWSFYGTTEEPGKGAIACGYFVTTVLRDIGFRIQRIKLAQCPSEEMIKVVCTHKSIRRYSNASISHFTKEAKQMGLGLYIVGLDNHTGFILNDGNEVYFVHSTFVKPACVISEKVIESKILAASKYRVIGKVEL